MAKLTPQQRMYIRKRTKVEEPDPSEAQGELNIIPFLDITVNLIMFLLMLTTTIAFFAQVEAKLPEYQRGGVGSNREESDSLNLNLTITENGVIVTGSGGKLAPGCEDTASGRVVTVPKNGDKYDWEGLKQCAVNIHKEFPDESKVTVSAEPLVQYKHVINAMDAVRSKGDEELFTDVLLSAGIR
jgi:biopolymer transport protein ExbD